MTHEFALQIMSRKYIVDSVFQFDTYCYDEFEDKLRSTKIKSYFQVHSIINGKFKQLSKFPICEIQLNLPLDPDFHFSVI